MNVTPRTVVVTAIGFVLQAIGVSIAILAVAAVAGLAVRVFCIVAGLV